MIIFNGSTNKDYLMVNTAKFRYPDGKEVAIDRDTTYFTIKDGKLSMEWRNCYFWDANGAKYLTKEDYKKLADAQLVGVEIEDDADSDYVVKISDWQS